MGWERKFCAGLKTCIWRSVLGLFMSCLLLKIRKRWFASSWLVFLTFSNIWLFQFHLDSFIVVGNGYGCWWAMLVLLVLLNGLSFFSTANATVYKWWVDLQSARNSFISGKCMCKHMWPKNMYASPWWQNPGTARHGQRCNGLLFLICLLLMSRAILQRLANMY